jgi:hypothetical protein
MPLPQKRIDELKRQLAEVRELGRKSPSRLYDEAFRGFNYSLYLHVDYILELIEADAAVEAHGPVDRLQKKLIPMLREVCGPRELEADFYDADGNIMDGAAGEPAKVIAAAVGFMILHGTDPDESGEGADLGRIKFYPADIEDSE